MLLYKEYDYEDIPFKTRRILYVSLYFDLGYMGITYTSIPFFSFREFPSNDVAKGLFGIPFI